MRQITLYSMVFQAKNPLFIQIRENLLSLHLALNLIPMHK